MTPEKKETGIDLVKSALQNDDGSLLDEVLSYCTALKQQQTGDNLVLNYKDHRNRCIQSFVKVSGNESDESFRRYVAWFEECMKVNGKGEKTKSARRIAKYLLQQYRDIFFEVLEEANLVPPPVMGVTEISAMFKMGGITSRAQRRGIMRVLRYHFGKRYFAPEYKVRMKCKGATQVETRKVSHSYEDGEKEEELIVSEKNLAAEVSAQLKVRRYSLVISYLH